MKRRTKISEKLEVGRLFIKSGQPLLIRDQIYEEKRRTNNNSRSNDKIHRIHPEQKNYRDKSE